MRHRGSLHVAGQLITQSVHRYDDPNIALVSGSMLRDCTRDESLARLVMAEPGLGNCSITAFLGMHGPWGRVPVAAG